MMSQLPPKSSSFLQKLFTRLKNDNSELNHMDRTLLDYYLDFAENHPGIFLVFSLDGKLLSHNEGSINQLLGYSPKKKVNFKNLISEENYLILKTTFHKSIKGSTERRLLSVHNKNGQQLFITTTFVPIKAKNNSIEGLFLIIEDITTQKKLANLYQLKASHLDHAQRIAQIGSFEYIIADNTINCSDTLHDIFETDPLEQISIETFFSLVDQKYSKKLNTLVQQAIDKGVGFETEFCIHRGNTGELRYLKTYVEAIKKDNQSNKLIGVTQDISFQKKLKDKLVETNNQFRHIFDHLNVGIWMRELIQGKLTFASKELANILQVPLDTLYREPDYWKDMILPMYKEELFKKYKLLPKGESVNHIFRINAGDGTTKWIYEQTIPKVNEYGEVTHLFGMVMDVSAEIEMQKKLEFLAKNDALTALPNQRSLNEKLDDLIENKNIQSFALLYIDLDDFSWVTDYLGYQIGDIVLQKVANKLVTLFPKDGYLAHINSDKFVFIISKYTSKDDVVRLAETIIKRVGEKMNVNGYEIYVTSSIGISYYPENGTNKLAIMENANAALFDAKNLGKSNFQVSSFNRDIHSHRKYMLEKDLRHAIKNEEFEVYYQPQVNPKNGVIEGAEALIRWNHKDWGIVSPDEFIPLAEQKHLIHDIGEWMIGQVCSHLKIWRDQGHSILPISINISPIQFLRKGLVETIERNLKKNQLPAKYLQLEITENTFLKNEQNVQLTLKSLKSLGVGIGIDDFGKGFSSFHYLRKFDVNTLKIDQFFIQNLNSDMDEDMVIVSSILHLGKGLNMRVIAEGVEEYEQMEFLRQKECDLVQGYLYSKPVPVEKFEQMVKTGYLYPKRKRTSRKPEKERRKYFRFEFQDPMIAKMKITEVNKRKVNVGSAEILIGNISLGGIKILSTLKLPVGSNIKFKFQFRLMDEPFDISGGLVWINEEKPKIFTYGVAFNISEQEMDKLSPIINKMTVLKGQNKEIPETEFINENPYLFLQRH